MRRIKRQSFNLIEIVLAIGAVAIGIVSIMALFPIGANASRDAMAEGYAAALADQILHHYASLARTSWSNVLALPEDNGVGSDLNDFSPTLEGGKTIYPKPGQTGVYKIIQYRDLDGDGSFSATEPLDFEAIVTVWRSRSDIFDLNQDGNFDNDDVNRDGLTNIADKTHAYNLAVKLNMCIAWPAQLPPNARKRNSYCLEIFNRTP